MKHEIPSTFAGNNTQYDIWFDDLISGNNNEHLSDNIPLIAYDFEWTDQLNTNFAPLRNHNPINQQTMFRPSPACK